MFNKLFFSLLFLVFFSCKNEKSNASFVDLDLMSYGMPIKIKAPKDPEIKTDNIGMIKEVTVKKGEGFYVQILSGTSFSNDLKSSVERQKTDIQEASFFSKMIEEYDGGFIFEKKYPELNDRITYDFRYVKIQGDNQFTYQAGLMGQYSLDQVKDMYNAVQ